MKRILATLLVWLTVVAVVAVPPASAVAPDPPTVTATAVSTSQIDVSWTLPNDNGTTIQGYTVTIAPDPGATITTNDGARTAEISGLAAGSTYTVSVVAVSDDEPSAAGTDAATTLATVPGAPTGVSAVLSGTTGASVSFSPPGSTGGSAITGYRVTSSPGGVQATGGASPIVVGGLSPGTTYTFTVVAINAIGTGPASGASNGVTVPANVPGAPTGVSAVLSGTTGASVSFSPPGSTGGSAITGYRVTSSPGGVQATGGASPIVVGGLSPGTTYTFTVVAINAAGAGAPSPASNQIATPGPPGAPTGVSAVLSGTTGASVSFSPPGSTGGSAITGYRVTSSPGGVQATGGASPIVVGGLSPGTTYTFTVVAINAIGTGPASGASAPVGVPTVPGLATDVDAENQVPYSSTVIVSWSPPADNGGTAVTSYKVTLAGRQLTVGGGARAATFDDVAVGTHVPTVVAVTSVGDGPSATGPQVEVRVFPPFDSESAFIRQLYVDFLDRRADGGGLTYWSGISADDGANITDVTRSFMFSPEFLPRRSITRLYLAFFDRRPDVSGFDFWARRINSGQANLDTISQSFVGSPEFQSTYGPLSDSDFIRLVYNNVLVRQPDQGGFQFWQRQLANGMTRGQLMTRFSESPEFIVATRPAVDVIVTYRGMLNRAPDDGGFIFWLGRIAGNPNAVADLIQGFYNSQEYADRIAP